MIHQLRLISNGKLLIVYKNDEDKYILRPYVKGEEYKDTIFKGTPEQFIQYSSHNMGDKKKASLISEALPRALEIQSKKRLASEKAEKELQKFKKSTEGTNIPGYSLDSIGIARVKNLIPEIEVEKRRNSWIYYFSKQLGIQFENK